MKNLIQKVFSEILENPEFNQTLIEKYFAKNYIQYVDNSQLTYEEFVLHIKKLKEKVAEQKVKIINYAENGNVIYTKHIAQSTLNDGSIVIHKVLAEFTIHNDKITQCDELTILLQGNENEKNLGSEL